MTAKICDWCGNLDDPAGAPGIQPSPCPCTQAAGEFRQRQAEEAIAHRMALARMRHAVIADQIRRAA